MSVQGQIVSRWTMQTGSAIGVAAGVYRGSVANQRHVLTTIHVTCTDLVPSNVNLILQVIDGVTTVFQTNIKSTHGSTHFTDLYIPMSENSTCSVLFTAVIAGGYQGIVASGFTIG